MNAKQFSHFFEGNMVQCIFVGKCAKMLAISVRRIGMYSGP